MKYRRGLARKVEKYFNKYFCKYKSKTRFNRFEYSAVKRMVYKEWYFDRNISFEDTYEREFFNDWVDRSRINLTLMGYIEGSKTSTGEKLFTGFKPNQAVVIGAVRNNNQSTIKQLPIPYKGGQ
jgi:hypothetical protein|nr:MAG TPA: hypothetical protein [Caudoviricetes sp.]